MAFASYKHIHSHISQQQGPSRCKGQLSWRGAERDRKQLQRRHLAKRLIMDATDREYLSDAIRTIPDFPHAGIMFQDVTSMLLDPKVIAPGCSVLMALHRRMPLC